MVLKFTLLLTLGGAVVAAILFGVLHHRSGCFWFVNAAAALVDWILQGFNPRSYCG